ncbi:MAG: hypothetical protein GF368_03700 [Candidatus Aenigmarchaeota archaeon]|nr:hypothetical protein [Candidatus Aenigmarchaeota archaeon]
MKVRIPVFYSKDEVIGFENPYGTRILAPEPLYRAYGGFARGIVDGVTQEALEHGFDAPDELAPEMERYILIEAWDRLDRFALLTDVVAVKGGVTVLNYPGITAQRLIDKTLGRI